jgi:hypothetical protein
VLLWNFKIFRPEPLPNCAQHPAQKTENEDNNKKLNGAQHPVEKLVPMPKPNSKPLLIGLPSATLVQNVISCGFISSLSGRIYLVLKT